VGCLGRTGFADKGLGRERNKAEMRRCKQLCS
jgi:hypothetical protein